MTIDSGTMRCSRRIRKGGKVLARGWIGHPPLGAMLLQGKRVGAVLRCRVVWIRPMGSGGGGACGSSVHACRGPASRIIVSKEICCGVEHFVMTRCVLGELLSGVQLLGKQTVSPGSRHRVGVRDRTGTWMTSKRDRCIRSCSLPCFVVSIIRH